MIIRKPIIKLNISLTFARNIIKSTMVLKYIISFPLQYTKYDYINRSNLYALIPNESIERDDKSRPMTKDNIDLLKGMAYKAKYLSNNTVEK